MPNEEMLNKYLSPKEIKAMTKSLRRAAIRASHLELPPSITTVEELHRYLDTSEPKDPRTPSDASEFDPAADGALKSVRSAQRFTDCPVAAVI